VRLLLDQHYSRRIAEQLRRLGHDVAAVEVRAGHRGKGDRDIWRLALEEQRALMTENVRHFVAILRETVLAGEHHFGLVFTSPRSMPRSAGTVGLFVEKLDQLLSDHPADDALADQVVWLS
jgi:hypothetical protein